MANFPVIIQTQSTNGLTAANPAVVDLIGSQVKSIDTLIFIMRTANGATHTTPTGWVDLVKNDVSDASNDCTSIFYRDGTTASTVSVPFSTSDNFAAQAFRVFNAAHPFERPPEVSATAVGTNTTPDPDTITPTGDAQDYLFLWLGGWDGDQTSPPTGAPTSYSTTAEGAISGIVGGAADCQVASAQRAVNTASENPGSWTISAAPTGWSAWVVAFHPRMRRRSATNFQDPAFL